MMGLKCKVPNTDFIAAALDEKLLTIGAGDNVVRCCRRSSSRTTISPKRSTRLDRACRTLRSQAALKISPMAALSAHFLDICDFEQAELRAILDRRRKR